MDRVYNFSAAGAMMPTEVLEKARTEFLNYKKKGMAVSELDYSSKEFAKLIADTEAALRSLMGIPQNYKVLFMPGGASSQHSAIPLNLLSDHRCADYIISGQQSKNASTEAKKYGDIAIAASSAGASPPYSTVPETKRSDFRPDADYVHICFNNTIYGTKYHYIPDTGNIPLVADMSSFLLSEPIEVSKFAMIYAASEGNVSMGGMSVVIVRDDLVGGARADAPSSLNYKVISEVKSMYDSPPVYSIYVLKLMIEWIESVGGLEEVKRRNEKKASLLYDYLDSQTYYTAPVDKKCRSMTNIVFVTGDANLDKKFADEAKRRGLLNLRGHSSVGGLRVSIYNSMPYEGILRLVEFMREFAQLNLKMQ